MNVMSVYLMTIPNVQIRNTADNVEYYNAEWMEYMNRKERDSNDYIYENESVSDLVTIVSVAVLADDDEYDYYLMKVSKVPFQLERVENDDWGNTFPVGANVAGVIIITEGNKIHLNMNLFEEG